MERSTAEGENLSRCVLRLRLYDRLGEGVSSSERLGGETREALLLFREGISLRQNQSTLI